METLFACFLWPYACYYCYFLLCLLYVIWCLIFTISADDLPPFALQDDRVVEIQGEPTGVHKAVELITGHLRKFLVDRSVLPLFEMHVNRFNSASWSMFISGT